jgi:hypothetical protein
MRSPKWVACRYPPIHREITPSQLLSQSLNVFDYIGTRIRGQVYMGRVEVSPSLRLAESVRLYEPVMNIQPVWR